ncbi:MAG: hypothetical protein AB1352_05595 [Patescibacteria group bacterium]
MLREIAASEEIKREAAIEALVMNIEELVLNPDWKGEQFWPQVSSIAEKVNCEFGLLGRKYGLEAVDEATQRLKRTLDKFKSTHLEAEQILQHLELLHGGEVY